MSNLEIVNYIKKELSSDVGHGQIRDALLVMGKSSEDINAAFAEFGVSVSANGFVNEIGVNKVNPSNSTPLQYLLCAIVLNLAGYFFAGLTFAGFPKNMIFFSLIFAIAGTCAVVSIQRKFKDKNSTNFSKKSLLVFALPSAAIGFGNSIASLLSMLK